MAISFDDRLPKTPRVVPGTATPSIAPGKPAEVVPLAPTDAPAANVAVTPQQASVARQQASGSQRDLAALQAKTGVLGTVETPSPEKAANEKIVSGWTSDWRTTLQTRPPEQTEKLRADAIDAIQTAQANFTKANGSIHRAQHAKAVYATTSGTLHVPESVPAKLAFGPFTPGANLRALVRISNVSGTVEGDEKKDLRGFALRLTDDKGHVQDIMMNTSEEFMAKDAVGAVVGFRVRGQGPQELAKAVVTGKLSLHDSIDLAKRGEHVLSNNTSVAAHTFWSRTPFQLGDTAVKIRLVPVDPHTQQPLVRGDEELSQDMKMRLQHAPVKYLLQVQGYQDEATTPINDARESWKSDYVTVGELSLPPLPKADAVADAQIATAESELDSLAFSIGNRWSPDDSSLKGVGDINSIREQAYKASAEGRGVKGASGLRCPLGYG